MLDQGRSRIRLTGPDTLRFLQGLWSADLSDATRAHAAALLTVKGKIVADAVIIPTRAGAGPSAIEGDIYDLWVPKASADEIHALLGRHVVMDDVELEAPVEGGFALVWDVDEPSLRAALATSRAEISPWSTRYPAPGWVLASGDASDLGPVLEALGTEGASAEVWNRYRVQTASPAWGHELGPGLFPPESGFVFAVSYDKGCYLGQEPLARIHARGQVQRVMVRVAGAQAIPTLTALHAADRADAGTLTTFVAAETGGFVGLAIVRRAVATPGGALHALVHDHPVELLVASEPLGDDPGIGSKRQATIRLGGA